MAQRADLLMQVWREVSRHIDIEGSFPRLVGLLRNEFPTGNKGLLRINLAQQRLDVVALDERHSSRSGFPQRRPLEEKELEDLLVWGREGTVLTTDGPAKNRRLLGLIHPGDDEDLLAGPLADDDGVHGMFVVGADRPAVFHADHVTLVEALLEPLTVALHNDQRVAEISALREAAEADKMSLLRRLGREALTDTIVGAESGLKAVMDRVGLVSASDLPVLILGETGSGKEVIARAIHERSPRREGPFLRVNCGAIPPELIDSELFGHEKGSFTGASALRLGWFERADTGTLFLDEVGEMPPAAQVRLLRVLQDGVFERVGGQRAITVDVRVIAATQPSLQIKVADGRFREDLWYRIAVFPIELPPLRDRPEDILTLANHCAQRSARRFGFTSQTVSSPDLALLLAYMWPGNVRELAAVIDRAAILGQGRRLEIAQALGMPLGPIGRVGEGNHPPAPVVGLPRNKTSTSPVGRTERLDDVIKAHIEQVLAAANGQIEGPLGAAKILGINPHTLRARMRKLHIDWSQFRTSS